MCDVEVFDLLHLMSLDDFLALDRDERDRVQREAHEQHHACCCVVCNFFDDEAVARIESAEAAY